MTDRRRSPIDADRDRASTALRSLQPVLVVIVALLWVGALGLFGACLAIEFQPRDRIEFQLEPAVMRPEIGRAFVADLHPSLPPWLEARGDTLSTGSGSDLVLLEDGTALGPSHSAHQPIREQGAGRFSHWHGHLLFSSSDGSDPSRNGRRYAVSVTPRAARWMESTAMGLALAAVAVGAVAWGAPRGRLMRLLPPIAFALTALALLVAWNAAIRSFAPSFAGVQADSSSYLDASTIRTIGYPLLLRAVAAVAGDLRPLVTVQVNLLILSYIALSAATAVVLGRVLPAAGPRDADGARAGRPAVFAPCWGVGAIALALMGTATRSMETSFTVMADGPFTAVACFAAALLGFAAVRRSALFAAGAGVALALAVLVRPAGIGLLPVLLLPWWWHRHDGAVDPRDGARPGPFARASLLFASVLPVVLILGTAAGVNWFRHGFFGLSRMGAMSIAGHVAWMISPESSPEHAELARRIQEKTRRIVERRPDLDWPVGYYLHTSEEYNPLLYQTLLPELAEWLREHPASDVDWDAAQERLLKDLALDAILHRPGDYAQHAAANVLGSAHWFGRGAAFLPGLRQAGEGCAKCVQALSPPSRALFEGWLEPPRLPERWNRNLIWERLRHPVDDRPRLFATLACAATLLGIALVPWSGRRVDGRAGLASRLAVSPGTRLLGALGLMVWGSIVLISISATVIFRYTDALDPLLSAAIVIGLVQAWRAIARRSALAPPRPAEAPAAA